MRSTPTPTLMFPSLLFLLLSITLLTPTHAEHHLQAHNPNSKCQHLQPDLGSTLQVLHAFHPCSPLRPKTTSSWEETAIQTLLDDQTRLLYLSSLVAGRSVAPVGWGRVLIQSPTYLVRVKVGTPPQTFLMAMDTSNHVGWLPCNGCIGGCGSSSSLFASDKSSSFKGVVCGTSQCSKVTNPICAQKLCTFNQTYGSSTLAAALSQDTLTLASDPIPGYLFGCIQKATGSSVPPQGLLGLGQGPLSLMSQSQHLYKSTFSYCLPSFKSTNMTGSLRLGPVAQPKRIQFTPLLKNPRRPTLYYVTLVGIRVGRKTLDILPSALSFNPTSGAGTVIDSGTVYTRLVQPVYTAVRDEFRRRMGKSKVSSLGGFDTCYTVPITIPTITFMFKGHNMTLPQDNFLIRSTSSSLACLAMAASPPPDNVDSVLNVIASMQQQNHRIFFDLPHNRVGIAREPCS